MVRLLKCELGPQAIAQYFRIVRSELEHLAQKDFDQHSYVYIVL